MPVERVECSACRDYPQYRSRCRECHGVGYIERRVRVEGCTMQQPECPVFYDPMCHGWECNKCGDSGPL